MTPSAGCRSTGSASPRAWSWKVRTPTTCAAGPATTWPWRRFARPGAAIIAIAGHRTTYGAPFRKIDKVRKGDDIVVTMPYGRFTYRVEGTRIVKPTDV